MEQTLTLKVPPPEMFDDYDTGGTWTPPPPAKVNPTDRNFIVYEATMPGADAMEIRADRNGYLMAVITGIRLANGYVLNAEYLSSAPFPKKDKQGNVIGTRNASALGNYFRAHGLQIRPASEQEYRAYVEATAGQTCHVAIDWEAYDKDSGTTVAKTYTEFPDDGRGGKQPWIEVGSDNRRCWAKARIKRWVDTL